MGQQDYLPAARIARQITAMAIKHGLPKGLMLNINIPAIPEEDIKGVHITRQGLRVYRDRLDKRIDPRGEPYYWIGGDTPTGIPEPGTDIGALAEGYVSITPLHLDLTAHTMMGKIKNFAWDAVRELIP